LVLARDAGDRDLQVLTRSYIAQAYSSSGNYRRSVAIFREILNEIASEPIERRFGLPFPAQVAFRCWLIWGLSRLGAFEEVDEIWAELVRLTRLADQPLSTTVAQYTRGLALVQQDAFDDGIRFLEQALASCERWGLYAWFTNIASCLGYAYASVGRTGRGLELLRKAVHRTRELRLMVNHAMEVAWLAEACAAAGLVEEAMRWSNDAVELSRLHQERGNEAYALWVSAKVALQVDVPGQIEPREWIDNAMAIASESGMTPVVSKCRALLTTRFHLPAMARPPKR
jgi:tetratricopeptide (TPR) repeat protein